jgi:hypothetical protein
METVYGLPIFITVTEQRRFAPPVFAKKLHAAQGRIVSSGSHPAAVGLHWTPGY